MKQDTSPTQLDIAVRAMRPAIGVAIFFSLFINLLALISPIYMLQVYDRVLTSRNQLTLLFITLIAVALFVVYCALEALRTQLLVRAGIKLEGDIRGGVFRSVLETTLTKRGIGPQAFRDMDVVRTFLTGAGLITFCDVPWAPVFVIACFILHPLFGILTIVGGVIILGLAIANDFATRKPLQHATTAAIGAQNEVGVTMRNAEVMHAMGMWPGLQKSLGGAARRHDRLARRPPAIGEETLMASIRFVRQVLQVLVLGGGAYLVIQGESSAGAMVAASILMGRALAPIEQAVGQWKGFIETRGSWDRLQDMFRADDKGGARMPLPRKRPRRSCPWKPPPSPRPARPGRR